jgi:Fur family ferric uptake transcriptional regulator
MAAVEIVGRVVGVNQSSVYRALRALAAAGVVHEVPRGFKTFYELGEEFCGHHHHVVCRVCGRTVAVSDERIEAMVTELTVGAGMVPVAHYIELYGVCRECRRRGLG